MWLKYLKQKSELKDSTQRAWHSTCIDECKAVEQRVKHAIAYSQHWSVHKHGSPTVPLGVIRLLLLLLKTLIDFMCHCVVIHCISHL